EDPRFELVAAITCRDDPRLGQPLNTGSLTIIATDTCRTSYDVMVDFSMPAGTMQWLEHCLACGSAMVIGATGHTAQQLQRITAASRKIAILRDSNFSVGISVLKSLVGDVAKRLGETYDIEIIEHHHNQKIDAPSGTAVSLTNTLAEATGRDAEKDVVHGRRGRTGIRPRRQIGVHAVRMGDLVGHHEVHFSGPGETLSLTHTAHSRDTFAHGALEAAAWIVDQPPGLYHMGDVLAG
ncbi:MAG: 4-hydroxy-tetrahydrodipicolinate reductase, partial [Phycisphaerae bacterium]